MTLEWRVYYESGRTFGSDDGEPHQAPARGAVLVVQPNDRLGTEILAGWDWLYWRADLGQWWGSEIHGLLDQMMERAHTITAVLQGRHCERDEWERIRRLAKTDPDFAPKTATARTEQPLFIGEHRVEGRGVVRR